ncbi:acyltransferase family protein [Subdoligranulum variabile]|uniref:Acyltransferase n=1 Tax=Subdoligranulum variabile DSM 15176 TaxID=411471 RepID=D1PNZ1_9FIRM|nr:acyltransferase [Subdoligranulum variabile]EFB75487.1 acyltransferase [Subdoligranulum variabile DSM 15176]UWP68939.1 acyltransferase [Subdoligranulum variabile]
MVKTPAHYRPGLDVIRLAALLPVLCYHFCIEAARLGFAVPALLIGRGMADWVEVGLAWFFLLSGAALCLQWQGRFRWRPYLVGRAAAMYPAFWLGFAALFLYGEVLHGNNAEIPRWRVVFSILGLDGYLAPVTLTFYKIGEWFLGVILLLYLVFPLVLWCLGSARRRRVLAVVMLLLQLVWPFLCPAPLEAGHTVLGRLPAFALGVWFGTLLKEDRTPLPRCLWALAALPLLWVPAVPRLAVLLAVSASLFWIVYAWGQRIPQRLWPILRRPAAWSYGVYLVHHVLLTLVLLPAAQRFGWPLPVWFPVFLVLSFVLAALLTAMTTPFSRWLKRLG